MAIEDNGVIKTSLGGRTFGIGEASRPRWGNGIGRTSPVDPSRALPICPYGCGEEGQLKEVVMTEEGRAIGIFADSDGCVFIADIEVGEPPTKKKLVIGSDGELMEAE